MICNDSDIVKIHAKYGLSGLLAVLDHIFLLLNEGIKPYYSNLKAEALLQLFLTTTGIYTSVLYMFALPCWI